MTTRSRRSALAKLGALSLALPGTMRAARAADAYTWRLSVPNAANGVLGTAALRFASGVHRRSNGQLTIDVYPNAQIAKEQEAVNSLQTGVIDMVMQSYAFLATIF